MARFQETMRRLAIFDEGLAEAGFGLDLAGPPALDAKVTALLQVAASVAIGSSAVCLQWSAARALAAGARLRTRSPTCSWRSSRWPALAGSYQQLPG
jgi:alkylhydroperoxidase/carboxymuconolactone decarboxylase family protein YurZ